MHVFISKEIAEYKYNRLHHKCLEKLKTVNSKPSKFRKGSAFICCFLSQSAIFPSSVVVVVLKVLPTVSPVCLDEMVCLSLFSF